MRRLMSIRIGALLAIALVAAACGGGESADPAPRPRRANVDAVLDALPANARVIDPGGCDAGLSPQSLHRFLPPLDEEDDDRDEDEDEDDDEDEDGAFRRPRASPSWMRKFADPTNRRDFSRGH